MSKEYLESLEKIKHEFNCDPEYYGLGSAFEILESALKRLESKDNAEPREALEDLIVMIAYFTRLDYVEPIVRNEIHDKFKDIYWHKLPHLDSIKKALLKAQKEHNSLNLLMQELDCKDFADLRKYARCGYEKLNNFKDSKEVKIEIPESSLMDYNPVKNCLKWEDLEFNHTPKIIDVKMNGNKYKLVVGYNVAGKNLAILRDGKKECYFLECDKQFFNDLHLERVEE